MTKEQKELEQKLGDRYCRDFCHPTNRCDDPCPDMLNHVKDRISLLAESELGWYDNVGYFPQAMYPSGLPKFIPLEKPEKD